MRIDFFLDFPCIGKYWRMFKNHISKVKSCQSFTFHLHVFGLVRWIFEICMCIGLVCVEQLKFGATHLFLGVLWCEEILGNIIWINTYGLSTIFQFVFYYLSSFALHTVEKVSSCKHRQSRLYSKRQNVIEMHILQMGKYFNWIIDRQRDRAIECVCEQYLLCSINCFQ